MLSAKIILKLKKLGVKFCKLESHRLNYKLESKNPESIRVDLNHTNSNQPIPADSTNIGLINY